MPREKVPDHLKRKRLVLYVNQEEAVVLHDTLLELRARHVGRLLAQVIAKHSTDFSAEFGKKYIPVTSLDCDVTPMFKAEKRRRAKA